MAAVSFSFPSIDAQSSPIFEISGMVEYAGSGMRVCVRGFAGMWVPHDFMYYIFEALDHGQTDRFKTARGYYFQFFLYILIYLY